MRSWPSVGRLLTSGKSWTLVHVSPVRALRFSRCDLHGKPGEKQESPAAKATFVRSRRVWRVFWMRRDLKWHGYEPALEVDSIEEFCALVDEDAYACFFG